MRYRDQLFHLRLWEDTSDNTTIAKLIQKIKKLEAGLSDINFDSNEISKLSQRIEKLEAAVESLPQTEGEKLRSQPPRNAAKKSSSPKKRQSIQPEPLIQSRLAERLGIHPSTITRRRDRDDFKAWGQHLDPEGWAWEYSWEDQTYYPV
ncbi:hypothetical protein NDI37_27075 [Funiculus sociatus GB2-A5]|uniref:Uncharacterized protein n=1 Tax=Funiculus sociatus GB2-A5 TaxID=2933946 RepID=A0ABV0JXK6_9CYAN|nr:MULTISPECIES: hypothetical protein [unclassified Trichocoleus]MBD1905589.1 hypothetical protein [Trichocoleus sp. FACHB-832]MBD2062824.1 hypothetical protein [Trichocoleus sp. FACHB-6]